MSEPKIVAERIRALLPDLHAAERRVARALLADYPVAGLETIARLAARSGTGGATVLRLVNRLGFSGYTDLQQALRDELADRQRSPLVAYEARTEGADDLPAAASDLFSRTVGTTVGDVDRTEFDRAVQLMADPKRRIATSGGRFSYLLAEYLTAHLQQMRPGAVTARAADRAAALLDLGRRDVVVLFDFRRYQADTVHFGRAAAERGATVVLVTDPWLSPLAAHASVVLTAEVEAPSPFDSLVPALALVDTLVAGVVRALGDAPRQRIAAYDEYWAQQHGSQGGPDE